MMYHFERYLGVGDIQYVSKPPRRTHHEVEAICIVDAS